MTDEREVVTLRTLSRWLVLAALVLVGVGLYFFVGRDATPVVPAVMVESGQ
jgi:hypothetical protein